MNLERLKEARNNRELVFLRMDEAKNRPLVVMDVYIKKILTEKPKSPNTSGDGIAARVRLHNGRCLIVFNHQLFSDHESAKLGYERDEQKDQP